MSRRGVTRQSHLKRQPEDGSLVVTLSKPSIARNLTIHTHFSAELTDRESAKDTKLVEMLLHCITLYQVEMP